MPDMKELLTDMRMEVVLSHVATMPIPLYERMKDVVNQANQTQQLLEMKDK